MGQINTEKYKEALNYRPETIKALFPNSNVLIVSGKVIHEAIRRKRLSGQKALTIAANGRNDWVIEGALRAAHKTGAVLLIEIAKSESGYCDVNFENLATKINTIAEKNNLQVVVAAHADHYAIKNSEDLEKAKKHIPEIINKGITSVAIDASHQSPDENVFSNLALAKLLPDWISLETEVGEIKGTEGLSTKEEALFHIRALNSRGVFPTWIALNNGSVHGLEATGGGIDVDLTAEIHRAVDEYGVHGAQHGTSGNNYDKLRDIVTKTHTTKANVATALQMVSWGLKVNEFGNAELDSNKNFIKVSDKGATDETWNKMLEMAKEKGWSGGSMKNLNLAADALMKAQPEEIQRRMASDVENFVTNLFENVFNCSDTVNFALDAILEAKSANIPHYDKVVEDESKWTEDYIRTEGKKLLEQQEVIEGNFDD